MNERLLKSEMVLYGDDKGTLSNYLGIARQSLSRKIKTGTFNQEEMTRIKIRYKLSNEKFAQIFTKELSTNES